MNKFTKSYSSIENIIQAQTEHKLTKSEIEALYTAQKALLCSASLPIFQKGSISMLSKSGNIGCVILIIYSYSSLTII